MKNFTKPLFQKLAKLPWFPITIFLIVVIFFSIRLIITYDSAHYLSYVSIFEGDTPFSEWDIARGPIFPALIYIFGILFGRTSAGILIGCFIFYLLFAYLCYQICQTICEKLKHKKLIQNIIFTILVLNPLILGYFHVMLTEFVAITFTMLNIYLAYKWLSQDFKNQKSLIFTTIYIICEIIFCYHLKQPYLIIAFIPFLVSAIIAVVKNHSFKNIIYRFGTLLASIVFLFISIFSWNQILSSSGIDMSSDRSSSSLLSKQLLYTYEITYDKNNDGEPDEASGTDAIAAVVSTIFTDPGNFLFVYIRNYCALTSTCLVVSEDTVNYVSTFQIVWLDTFENTAIAYLPYRPESNIFPMTTELHERAAIYGESTDVSTVAHLIGLFQKPTNILFKISTLGCFIFLIVLVVAKLKYKNPTTLSLFHLNLILLVTSFSHMFISAAGGLLIDRYAIEIFIPSLLGIFGTCIYIIYSKKPISKRKARHAKA